jgi:hypothetical protein
MRYSFLLIYVVMLGCAPTVPKSKETQLQIRQFQTRTFESGDSKVVMKAMINVLQDDAYIIRDANLELGLLSGSKEVDVESTGEAVFATLFAGNQARWAKNSIIDITANITEYGEQCRVRVNFQMKKMNNKGEVMDVSPIDDEQHYTQFYDKVSKGIFLQEEGL